MTYYQTDFNRRGNLYGGECVDGMLLAMYRAARESKADVIVKIDSDHILNSIQCYTDFEPLKNHIGFQIAQQEQLSGGYSLPSSAIPDMIRANKKYMSDATLPETLLMTRLTKEVGLNHVRHICNSTNKDIWRASSIHEGELQGEVISNHTFGVMLNLDLIFCELISEHQDKNRNYTLMKSYLDRKILLDR